MTTNATPASVARSTPAPTPAATPADATSDTPGTPATASPATASPATPAIATPATATPATPADAAPRATRPQQLPLDGLAVPSRHLSALPRAAAASSPDVPLQFRLDERTRRRGLDHIAAIRRQLAERAPVGDHGHAAATSSSAVGSGTRSDRSAA
jgi:hypothetical protein